MAINKAITNTQPSRPRPIIQPIIELMALMSIMSDVHCAEAADLCPDCLRIGSLAMRRHSSAQR
jgi:hypothetical protein